MPSQVRVAASSSPLGSGVSAIVSTDDSPQARHHRCSSTACSSVRVSPSWSPGCLQAGQVATGSTGVESRSMLFPL